MHAKVTQLTYLNYDDHIKHSHDPPHYRFLYNCVQSRRCCTHGLQQTCSQLIGELSALKKTD